MAWRFLAFLFGAVIWCCGGLTAEQPLVWSTPNQAYYLDRPFEEFVQPTESGLVESGLFGCVRTNGRQFHEGIDLYPLSRDRRGEAADPVFAMAAGVVRHASAKAGASSYGRYVVVEHTEMRPRAISLYAHLLSVAGEARPGASTAAGTTLGIMGRSAAGYSIPKDRAHAHVEMGLWLSEKFQTWYRGRKFGSPNEHGLFNGMNIVGFDWMDYLDRRRAGEVQNTSEYLARLPTAVTVVRRSAATPDFVSRYPELLRAPLPATGVAGWRIEFSWFGLPKAWWPLDAAELENVRGGGDTAIVFHDRELLERFPCQAVVRIRSGGVVPGSKLADVLEILFAGL